MTTSRKTMSRAARTLGLLGALGLALAGPTGCAAVEALLRASVEDPKVIITGARLRHATLDEIAATFDVEIENPNPFGLKLAGIEYELDVEGERLAQGRSQKGVSLAPNGKTDATLDVEIPLATAAGPLQDILNEDEVAYTLHAAFLVGTEDYHVAIPATFRGVFVPPKMPRVAVSRVGFTDVSSAGVGVRVLARVHNPNGFPIPLDLLRASFFFGGREILKNQTLAGVVLPAGQTVDVPIDFTVGLGQLGLSLADLAKRPQLRWKLVLRLESGQTVLPYTRSGVTNLVPGSG